MDAFTRALKVTAVPCVVLVEDAESVVVVLAVVLVTLTLTGLDVEPPNVLVPEKVAVMEWEPTDRADVVKVATPPESVAVPSAAPS